MKPNRITSIPFLFALLITACGSESQNNQILCVDRCLPGQTECQGAGVLMCVDANGDGCLEWGDWVACQGNQICVAGACQPDNQTGECLQPGQRRCQGDGYQVCGDPDDDGLLDWSGVVACPQGQTCQNSECVDLPPEPNCTNDGQEPNDSAGQAIRIDGGEIRGLVICERDQDWFTVGLGASDTLEATATFDGDASAMELSLMDAQGTRLAAASLSGSSLGLQAQVDASASYYLVVAGRGEATGRYRLSVVRHPVEVEECIDDRFEENDSLQAATSVIAGNGTDLKICGNDEDWFGIELQAGDNLRVEIQFANRLGDLDLWLYDAQGNLIGNSSSQADFETLSGTSLVAGRLHVMVRGNGAVENSYSLLLEVTSQEVCVPDPFESNDSWQQASEIGTGQIPDLTLCKSDQDWYSVSLAQGDALKVDLFFSHREGNLDVVVFDPYSNQVATGESITDNESMTLYAAATGQYTLQVVAPADEIIHYALHLTVETSDECIDDPYESNNNFLTAYPLEVFAQVQNRFPGLKLCAYDKDWYKVYMYAGETLMLDMRFTHSQGDLDLYLLSDYLEALSWSTSYSDNESIQVQIPWDGIYYIRVSGFGESNSYDLTVGIY